jgi:hypothetical protein
MFSKLQRSATIVVLAVVMLVAVKIVFALAGGLGQKKLTATKAVIAQYVADVLVASNRLQALPESREAVSRIIGRPPPMSAWKEPVNYERLDSNRFKVFTITPYPAWTVIEYDSSLPDRGVTSYPF